ncbi:MAG: aminotransferase-like domain-containing protein [Planctomycetota bacterium]|jgi:DNA-binding transcriptional MocR family regulator
METNESPLYRQAADRVLSMIESGAMIPGERLPSIRRQSQVWGVSVNTISAAYQLLVREGRLEARPQSGYYVTEVKQPTIESPTQIDLACEPTVVSLGERFVKTVREVMGQPLNLGCSLPDPETVPTRILSRLSHRVMRQRPKEIHEYQLGKGCLELRQQVCRLALQAGAILSPDEVTITNGCQEAICLALGSICEPGDLVAVESPLYWALSRILEQEKLKAIEIPSDPKTGVSLETLEFAFSHFPIKACLFNPTANNPTGAIMPNERKERLAALLAERQVPLIEDDIYGDLCRQEPRPRTVKSYDQEGWVILCSSFSKTVSPGYRLGWVAGGRYQEEIEARKTTLNYGTAPLLQHTMAEFLAEGHYDRHLRHQNRLYEEQILRMRTAIARYFPEGTRVTDPAGGFLLWVELPPRCSGVSLYERAAEQGIAVAPGELFSINRSYRNFIRLSAGYHWSEELEVAVRTIGELARAM